MLNYLGWQTGGWTRSWAGQVQVHHWGTRGHFCWDVWLLIAYLNLLFVRTESHLLIVFCDYLMSMFIQVSRENIAFKVKENDALVFFSDQQSNPKLENVWHFSPKIFRISGIAWTVPGQKLFQVSLSPFDLVEASFAIRNWSGETPLDSNQGHLVEFMDVFESKMCWCIECGL